MRTSLFRAAAALAVLVLLPLSAAAAEFSQRYDVYVGGIKIGGLGLNARVEGDRYSASGRVGAGGLIGVFVSFDFSGQSIGTIRADGSLRPEEYSARQGSGSKVRETLIVYRNGTPADVRFTPDRTKRPNDLAPSTQGGTLDPVAATLALLADAPVGRACGRSIEIYDGTKRSRIRVNARQRGGDGLFTCTGVYSRVAGFSKKDMAKQTDFPFAMTFREQGGVMQVVRFQTESTFGLATAIRR